MALIPLAPVRSLMAGCARLLYRSLPLPAAHKEQLKTGFLRRFGRALGLTHPPDYTTWLRRFDRLSDDDRQSIRAHIARLAQRPRISVLMPLGKARPAQVEESIDSVAQQIYPEWELCVACSPATPDDVRGAVASRQTEEPRIRLVEAAEPGEAAGAQAALEACTGAFAALLGGHDLLAEHALYLVAEEAERNPGALLIYGDEDLVNDEGKRRDPHFKPAWSPELLLSHNYLGRFCAFGAEAARSAGGFDRSREGAHEYDLFLRLGANAPAGAIRHVPWLLYHRRSDAGDAREGGEASSAFRSGLAALQAHLARIGSGATAAAACSGRTYRVTFPLSDPTPQVSLIVPTRDQAGLLRGCVSGLLHETDYPALEVIVMDNQSREAETLAYFEELEGEPRVKVVSFDRPFNYAALNNEGVRQASGELIGLINNDIQVIAPGWLREMASHAVRPGVGIVGGKLYYGNDTVQHGGVILEIEGRAGHFHRYLPRSEPGYQGRALHLQNFSAVTGACLLMRRGLYLEVGGLPEDLAVAFNDVELCLKVRARGERIVWTPHAELYHLESMSRGYEDSPEKRRRLDAEDAILKARWGDALRDDPYYNPNMTLASERGGLAFPPRVRKPWLA